MAYPKGREPGERRPLPPKPPAPEAILEELKRRGYAYDPITDEERNRRKAELKRCALDVVYWIDNYCYTYDPRLEERYVPFKLYPHQIECLRWLEERQRNKESCVIEKSRDTGVTWMLSDFLLHRFLFSRGFAGGVGSRKLEYVDNIGDPKTIFEKFRMTLRKLPPWMMPPGFDWKKDSFEGRLLNRASEGSLIGEGGDNIGRGGRTSLFFVDEYNLLEHPETADAALRDNTNMIIYVGTPNGMTGIYEKREIWPCFQMHWKDDPRKNYWILKGGGQNAHADSVVSDAAPVGVLEGHGWNAPTGAVYPWYEAQVEKHRDQPWIVRQEIDIDYLGSGFPRFNREFLAKLRKQMPEPVYTETPGRSAWAAEVRTWKEPEYRRRYLIVSDVAEGKSNTAGDPDFSVSHVYDIEDWEQVCTYRGRPDTHAYAIDLAALGEMYNWADIAVERTGPGLSTVTTLTQECGYPGVWCDEDGEPGLRAGHRSKVESEADLAGFIEDMAQGFKGFVWKDAHTIDELIHFMVKPNGRAEAEASWHDDAVTCCKLAASLLPQLTGRRKMTELLPPPPKIFYGGGGRRGLR